jgi:hypothetical protein
MSVLFCAYPLPPICSLKYSCSNHLRKISVFFFVWNKKSWDTSLLLQHGWIRQPDIPGYQQILLDPKWSQLLTRQLTTMVAFFLSLSSYCMLLSWSVEVIAKSSLKIGPCSSRLGRIYQWNWAYIKIRAKI